MEKRYTARNYPPISMLVFFGTIRHFTASPVTAGKKLGAAAGANMDAIELAALTKLGERSHWGVDELPDGIDVDMLRCLDLLEVIEVRFVTMQNRQQYPGDPTPPAPSHSAWFSPMKVPAMAGTWDVIVERRQRSMFNHPSEVRVSERGKAEMTRMTRAGSSPGAEAKNRRDSAPAEYLDTDPQARPLLASNESASRMVIARDDRLMAGAFRRGGDAVYPGVLLVLRPPSASTHPVEDTEYNPAAEWAVGIALWGATKEFWTGAARLEADDANLYVPVVAGDFERPRTLVGLVDAWVLRADTLRAFRRGTLTGFGPTPLSPSQVAAAFEQIELLIRDRSSKLLTAAPPSVRPMLAAIADAPSLDDDLLTKAIQELLVASVDWRAGSSRLDSDGRGAAGFAGRASPGGTAFLQQSDPTAPISVTRATFLSEAELAGHFRVSQDSLRKKLREWRPSHRNNDWIEVTDRRPHDPKFLYRVESVLPIIRSLPQTGQ